jgi:phytoene/squalene synthetase
LKEWEAALMNARSRPFVIKESVGSFEASEAELLLQSSKIQQAFHRHPEVKEKIFAQEMLQTLFRGMQLLLQAQEQIGKEEGVLAIHKSKAEFDFYCYAHAGCVGRFWNQIFGLPHDLENFAVEYGKALERINILRDLKADHARGILLLDRESLQKFSLQTLQPW